MSNVRSDDLQAVSDFLDRNWDPIGVYSPPFGTADVPAWPPGEYLLYAEGIVDDLRSGVVTTADLIGHLQKGRTMIGQDEAANRGRDAEVAEALLSWWASR